MKSWLLHGGCDREAKHDKHEDELRKGKFFIKLMDLMDCDNQWIKNICKLERVSREEMPEVVQQCNDLEKSLVIVIAMDQASSLTINSSIASQLTSHNNDSNNNLYQKCDAKKFYFLATSKLLNVYRHVFFSHKNKCN